MYHTGSGRDSGRRSRITSAAIPSSTDARPGYDSPRMIHVPPASVGASSSTSSLALSYADANGSASGSGSGGAFSAASLSSASLSSRSAHSPGDANPGFPDGAIASTSALDVVCPRERSRSTGTGIGSAQQQERRRPVTPSKGKAVAYGDRFIPNREGVDLQATYQLMGEAGPSTPTKSKRKVHVETDAQREADRAFTSLITAELYGIDPTISIPSSPSPFSSAGASSTSGSASRHTSYGPYAEANGVGSNNGVVGLPTPSTPTKKKNLFQYKSPQRARTPYMVTPGRAGSGGRAVDATPTGERSFGGGLFGNGAGVVGNGDASGTLGVGLDSPNHDAYSLSPVRFESQKLLLSPRKSTRTLSKLPYKVLDAPELADDFYLNLVDWSSTNVLGVGLGSCVYLWSAPTSKVTKLLDLSTARDKVTSVSWGQKGQHLAVGTATGKVQIWDAEKCKLVRSMSGHTARCGALAWNAHILTSGSRDRSIMHRDLRVPAHHIQQLTGHRQEVCGLRWNGEANQLASGGNDNKLIVWNGLESQPLYRFNEHVAAVKAIAWNPHQHGILASGGGTADKKIRFWNTLTGSMLSEIDTGSQLCNLMWSKTSNEIVSTHGYSSNSAQNQVCIWKYPSMQQVATLTGHTMRVLYLAMSPDGQTIVTGAGDETLRFWNAFQKAGKKEHKAEQSALNPFAKIR